MEQANSVLKIAIDFGGVLSIHDRIYKGDDKGQSVQNADDKVGQHRSTTVNMPGALEALVSLKTKGIPEIAKIEYDLISFAGKTRASETKDSLIKTTNLFDNLYFTKSKQNKKFVCQYLGCDVMIDDTLDILEDISKSYKNKTNNAPYLILFTGDPSYSENQVDLTGIKDVSLVKPEEISKGEIVLANSWNAINEFIQKVSWNTLNKADVSIPLSKFIYQL